MSEGAANYRVRGPQHPFASTYPKDLGELGWRLFPIFENGRPVDPWGRPLRYRSPGTDGRPFDLGSTGPDGVKSGDDIGNVP